MTLLDVEELCAYWVDHPPVHLTLAAYFGIGRHKPRSVAGRSSPDLRSELAELPPGALVERNVHEGLPPVVLDFSELKRVSGMRR